MSENDREYNNPVFRCDVSFDGESKECKVTLKNGESTTLPADALEMLLGLERRDPYSALGVWMLLVKEIKNLQKKFEEGVLPACYSDDLAGMKWFIEGVIPNMPIENRIDALRGFQVGRIYGETFTAALSQPLHVGQKVLKGADALAGRPHTGKDHQKTARAYLNYMRSGVKQGFARQRACRDAGIEVAQFYRHLKKAKAEDPVLAEAIVEAETKLKK